MIGIKVIDMHKVQHEFKPMPGTKLHYELLSSGYLDIKEDLTLQTPDGAAMVSRSIVLFKEPQEVALVEFETKT